MFDETHMYSNRHHHTFLIRVLILALMALCGLALIVARVSYLTLGRGDQLYRLSEENFLSRENIPPPRGTITDRYGQLLATSEPRFHVSVSPFKITSATLDLTMRTVGHFIPAARMPSVEDVMRLRPPWKQERLASYLTMAEVLPLMERQANLPGLQIEQDFKRTYAHGRETAQLTGYVGSIPPRQLELYEERGYGREDVVGLAGIENRYESRLRGTKGEQIVRRDARGQVLQRLFVDEESKAVRGAKVVLTLDMDLQTTVTRLLTGQEGSIVVLDPRNGDVLAMASMPNYDANSPETIGRDGDSSYFKAIRTHTAPGSTFKLVTATAYLTAGGSPDRMVNCAGKLEIAPDFWRYCDVRTGHGPLNLRQALCYSCNIYFYRLALEMPLDHLIATAQAFGFGERTGIAITTRGESPGRLGRRGGRPPLADKVMLAIGQGQLISATPIQLAVAYSTLANGGTRYEPRVVDHIESPTGERMDFPPVVKGAIGWTAAQREVLLEGFHDAVNERWGTARHANFSPEIRPLVAGKTGTAQRMKGTEVVADAFFACFAPWRDPEICVVVVLEEAGHGGEMAAPVAKKVVEEYFRLKAQRAQSATPPVAPPDARVAAAPVP